MPTGSVLTVGDGYVVSDFRCPDVCSSFDPVGVTARHVLVVVRRGAFVRRTRGRDVLHDATIGYLAAPGEAAQFAHPVPGGDACTAIRMSPSFIARLAGGDPALDVPELPTDGASDTALRRITAHAADPAERLVLTVAALLARRFPERVASGRPGTESARRRVFHAAREILHAEPRTGLLELSHRVGCSPHHLSRVFSQFSGSGVSRYRIRIRVGEALERLAADETDLAALAYDLGFADQAHLTRTIRDLTGHPPTAWRRGLQG